MIRENLELGVKVMLILPEYDFFFFWWYWGLNSRLLLPLEPHFSPHFPALERVLLSGYVVQGGLKLAM
jgi:hypothetical protein